MKLLFDQNLSPKLTSYFSDAFEEVIHVQALQLDKADDLDRIQAFDNNAKSGILSIF